MTGTSLTPMMEQYLRIKDKYRDCLLLFRLGDFYEAFFEDAETLSRVLRIVLTSRNGNPMAGIPYHSLSQYLKKLIDAGFKVAICEQVEDPSLSKGLVKREVTRVVSPGVLVDDELLSEENNFLMIISLHSGEYPVAISDISTGQLSVTTCSNAEGVVDHIAAFSPSQILVQRSLKNIFKRVLGENARCFTEYLEDWNFAFSSGVEYIKRVYGIATLESLELTEGETRLLGALFKYVEESQRDLVKQFDLPMKFGATDFMQIDSVTFDNLSLLKDQSGTSLFECLKETVTPMGTRLLKERLRRPSTDLSKIERRLDKIDFLARKSDISESLRRILSRMGDLERIASRLVSERCSPRDLSNLREALGLLPEVASFLSESPEFDEIVGSVPDLSNEYDYLKCAIQDNPASSAGQGGVIRNGFSNELDELSELVNSATEKMKDFQKEERASTGIAGLKVKHNKVFGYFIEVPRSQAGSVPADYARKQTLVNAERYINDQLKDYEEKLLSAGERLELLERELFQNVCKRIATMAEELRRAACVIAEIDVSLSNVMTAVKRQYCRPVFSLDHVMRLKDSRHPVVERFVEHFVPNDVEFNSEKRFAILTGPNMSGKSTYLRQIGLISILAQAGCYVPAEEALLPLYDRVFTRIGAKDDIAGGKSTFLVEMVETATILLNAGEKSLVLLDEVGRGTSTFDGISIAWAVSEYINEVLCSHTVFATHFTELTEMADIYPEVRNITVRIEERSDGIVFLHKVSDGVADRSYGIDVAKLAGIPQSVLERSREILEIIVKTTALDKAVRVLTKEEVKEIKRSKKERTSRDQMRLF